MMSKWKYLRLIADVVGWGDRLASLLVVAQIGFVLLFYVGEGGLVGASLEKPLLFFLAYPGGVIAGMILAWWRPGLGGMVMLLSLAGWLLFGREPGGAAFPGTGLVITLALLADWRNDELRTRSNFKCRRDTAGVLSAFVASRLSSATSRNVPP